MPAVAAAAAAADPTPKYGERVEHYEQRTATALIAASLLYLAVYATQVLWIGAPPGAHLALGVLEYLIWAVFIVDFAVRVWLAEGRWRYVVSHPVDVITILLPMFRPLRALRVFASARVLVGRGRFLRFGRVAAGITLAAVFIAVTGALIELDLERHADGATITTFGDALWWSAVTMSTVGYGDTYPVTGAGQVAAVGMLVVGISTLGAVTATFASWVTQWVGSEERKAEEAILAELRALRAEVVDLREQHRNLAADLQRGPES